jgi:hypothetical protein
MNNETEAERVIRETLENEELQKRYYVDLDQDEQAEEALLFEEEEE